MMKLQLVRWLTLAAALVALGAPALAYADSKATVAQNAVLTITDTGFSPATVAVVPGGILTIVNNGSTVHKAQAPAVGTRLESGDLAPGQSTVIRMPASGGYTFQSASDAMTGNTPFDQSASALVLVSRAAIGTAVDQPAQFSGPLVVIPDAGVQQSAIEVQAGQTVIWFNVGDKAHSVAGSTGTASFDSGAISDGGSFAVIFSQPGSYSYSLPLDAQTGTVVVS